MKKSIFFAVAGVAIAVGLHAQNVSVPQIGTEAPSFKASSTEGKISFPADYGENWKILLSHPKNFTPVCSSEILELAKEQDEFDRLGVKLLVVSVDELHQHTSWIKALEEIQIEGEQSVNIEFPLVEDINFKVSKLYGMLHPEANTQINVRGVFIIDPDNRIRSVQFYPMEVGRNTAELIRTVKALQVSYADNNLVTPANWQQGDDYIVPVLSAEDMAALGNSDSQFYQRAWFLTYKKAM